MRFCIWKGWRISEIGYLVRKWLKLWVLNLKVNFVEVYNINRKVYVL